jgi:hypothetical protein
MALSPARGLWTHRARPAWGHIGATTGGETAGTEGNRSNAKLQVTNSFALIALVAKVL